MKFLIGFIFQYYIFNNYRDWWNEYNYILATALDTGSGIQAMIESAIGSFFDVKYPIWALNPNPDTRAADYYCFGQSYK